MFPHLKRLFTIIMAFTLFACSESESPAHPLCFIGDSIIARWNVFEYFPSRYVDNMGISGSGIDYINSLAGKMTADDVVLLFGTNDNTVMVAHARDEYARKYVQAVLNLDASHIYLFSVLPRDFGGDREGLNDDILMFNRTIQNLVSEYPQITYINVYPDFIHDGKIERQLYSDGLHLSPYGYEILTQALINKL